MFSENLTLGNSKIASNENKNYASSNPTGP